MNEPEDSDAAQTSVEGDIFLAIDSSTEVEELMADARFRSQGLVNASWGNCRDWLLADSAVVNSNAFEDGFTAFFVSDRKHSCGTPVLGAMGLRHLKGLVFGVPS
jgi:hypothetical protein